MVMIILCNFCIAICLPCLYIGTQICTLFFSEKTQSMNPPPRFPNRALWRELPTYKAFFFLHISQIPYKNAPK